MSARRSLMKVCSPNSTVPEQMLERLALAAPPHQIAERDQLRLGERPFELEIKLDPFFA